MQIGQDNAKIFINDTIVSALINLKPFITWYIYVPYVKA